MNRYTQRELFKMDAVEVYKLLLRGEIKKFPNGFWVQPEAKQNAAKCTRFAIEELLKLDDEEVKKVVNTTFFKKIKLLGMVSICFDDSPFKALDNAYPNKFKPWQLGTVSMSYWVDINNVIHATKWLVEEQLKFTDQEIKDKLCRKMFEDNGLGTMIDKRFKCSVGAALDVAYPGRFKVWEFNRVSEGYWKDINNGIKATKWLIEEKLKLTEEELKSELSREMFSRYNLISMLNHSFGGSPFKAIDTLYPGRFREWEFKNVPVGYWKDINNRIKAVKWLAEEKLGIDVKDVEVRLKRDDFESNGLYGLFTGYYDKKVKQALAEAYPELFRDKINNTNRLNLFNREEE